MLKKLSDCLRRHTFLCCVVLTGMLVLSVVAGISLGTAKISFSTVWRIILHNLFGLFSIDDIKLSTLNIVWRIRIPRALLGMVVGGSLTLSGISVKCPPCQGQFNSEGWSKPGPHDMMILLYHPGG